MKQFISLLLAIGLSLSALNRTCAQTPQSQDEVIRFRTNEVKLDIIVKDKKGRPVKDLTAADFEVLEDGVSQNIRSFNFVNRDALVEAVRTPDRKESTSESPATTPLVKPVRATPGITALVFLIDFRLKRVHLPKRLGSLMHRRGWLEVITPAYSELISR